MRCRMIRIAVSNGRPQKLGQVDDACGTRAARCLLLLARRFPFRSLRTRRLVVRCASHRCQLAPDMLPYNLFPPLSSYTVHLTVSAGPPHGGHRSRSGFVNLRFLCTLCCT